MKRRLLMTMMAMVLVFSLAGCGSKKDEPTTAASTEAESEVKDELIQFIGTDIPKVEADEAAVMKSYNSYFAEGATIDTDTLLKDLTDNIIPKYKAFLDSVQAIELKTDEVKALRDQYYDAMRLYRRCRQL